ncbi:MAG: GNAT family N-acetyltransferase [Promethearchaeota archaeon]
MSEQKNISIREFRPSDLAVVKRLILNTIDNCYTETYPKEAVKFFEDWHCDEKILEDANKGYTIVLEKNNQIVGTGTILENEIKRLFVEAKLQKHGLGKLIMRKLEEKAASLGIDVIKLDASIPSKKFYDSLGYVTLEETFLEVENGQRLDHYKMEKSLTPITYDGTIQQR